LALPLHSTAVVFQLAHGDVAKFLLVRPAVRRASFMIAGLPLTPRKLWPLASAAAVMSGVHIANRRAIAPRCSLEKSACIPELASGRENDLRVS